MLRAALAILSLVAATLACAADPDTYLLEYESFVPNKWFNDRAGPSEPLLTVISTEDAWRSLWASFEPRMAREPARRQPYPLPPIDFSRYSLVVAALGPSGDDSVAIRTIRDLGSKITVSLVAVRPGRGCMVTTDVKYPIALALIARTDKPVSFGVVKAVVSCTSTDH
jgi:hypothetical protein